MAVPPATRPLVADAALANLPRELVVDEPARAAHLERRVAALFRQLALRIDEVADARRESDKLREELEQARAKAEELDLLMATRTMRLLRGPRAVYGRILESRRRGNHDAMTSG
jgi:hypothetical protein